MWDHLILGVWMLGKRLMEGEFKGFYIQRVSYARGFIFKGFYIVQNNATLNNSVNLESARAIPNSDSLRCHRPNRDFLRRPIL